MTETTRKLHNLTYEVIEMKKECGHGHKIGEKKAISCWDTAGMCGFFYHDIFPTLSVMQFDGGYPWGGADETTLECPDRVVGVKIIVRREPE